MTEHKNRDFYRWTRDKQKAFEEQVKEANDSKFPKTGGKITGPIEIDIPGRRVSPEIPIRFRVEYHETSKYTWAFSISTVTSTFELVYGTSRSLLAVSPAMGLYPTDIDPRFSLGTEYRPWPNVYTKKLNNGADLELPTKAGTVALLSDIEDILKKYNLIPETKE